MPSTSSDGVSPPSLSQQIAQQVGVSPLLLLAAAPTSSSSTAGLLADIPQKISQALQSLDLGELVDSVMTSLSKLRVEDLSLDQVADSLQSAVAVGAATMASGSLGAKETSLDTAAHAAGLRWARMLAHLSGQSCQSSVKGGPGFPQLSAIGSLGELCSAYGEHFWMRLDMFCFSLLLAPYVARQLASPVDDAVECVAPAIKRPLSMLSSSSITAVLKTVPERVCGPERAAKIQLVLADAAHSAHSLWQTASSTTKELVNRQIVAPVRSRFPALLPPEQSSSSTAQPPQVGGGVGGVGDQPGRIGVDLVRGTDQAEMSTRTGMSSNSGSDVEGHADHRRMSEQHPLMLPTPEKRALGTGMPGSFVGPATSSSSSSGPPLSRREIVVNSLQASLMAVAAGIYVFPGPTLFATHLLGAVLHSGRAGLRSESRRVLFPAAQKFLGDASEKLVSAVGSGGARGNSDPDRVFFTFAVGLGAVLGGLAVVGAFAPSGTGACSASVPPGSLPPGASFLEGNNSSMPRSLMDPMAGGPPTGAFPGAAPGGHGVSGGYPSNSLVPAYGAPQQGGMPGGGQYGAQPVGGHHFPPARHTMPPGTL
ncbi:unnamed protein product [Amoebophrya sp. A25]|nr:unnamed protein product [Amoebophrya sp. A25]|eukprot:GSA25T00013216001.1